MRDSFKNLTSTGVVSSGECVLDSMYVNSTASGAIVLYSSSSTATNTGAVIGGTITPAAGFHWLGHLNCTAGLYVGVPTGTINVTFHLRENNN